MLKSNAVHVSSTRSIFTRLFHLAHPRAEGAELHACCWLASCFSSSTKEAVIPYGENLQQNRDALISHINSCVRCVQSLSIRNRLPAVAERALGRCPRTWPFGLPAVGELGKRATVRPRPT
jgi:hypothetical protein